MNHPAEAIDVREAVVTDAPAFAAFVHRAWREAGPDAPGFAGATEESIAEIVSPSAYERSIGGPDRRMFLAWDHTQVVGFASTRRVDATTLELSGIVVLTSHSGRGIGTMLVNAAKSSARNEGFSAMLVKTETTNRRARAFYEKIGFDLEGIEIETVDDTDVEVWRLARPI